jgi:hypothetical protein
VIEECFISVQALLGTKAACLAVDRPRATHYRRAAAPKPRAARAPRPAPPNKLSDAEAAAVLEALRSPRFVDSSPAQVFHVLLDERTYLASVSTYYRLLRSCCEVRERRRQAAHPPRQRPELVATGPNMVWSWDITKLKGPRRGEYYDLYVVIDIFSRYVVAWLGGDRAGPGRLRRGDGHHVRWATAAPDDLPRAGGLVVMLDPRLLGAPALADHDLDLDGAERVTYLLEQSFRYDYPMPARRLRHQLVVLPPLRHGSQHLRAHRLDVHGARVRRVTRRDRHGNIVVRLSTDQVEASVQFRVGALLERVRRTAPYGCPRPRSATRGFWVPPP